MPGIDDQSGLEALAKLNGGLNLTPETSQELKDDLNSMMEMPTDGAAMSESMLEATLTAPDAIGPRSRIAVEFTGPMDSSDYIGLAAAGAKDVLAVARAGNAGNVLLVAPRAEGRYELRYYTAGGEVLAQRIIDFGSHLFKKSKMAPIVIGASY